MDNDFWLGRNIFVTGATGFVGSWLTKSLVAKRSNVVVSTRDFVPISPLYDLSVYSKLKAIVQCDIRNYETVERIFNEYEIDTCFHLAAQSIVRIANRSPLSTFETNIKGTWNILEAARVSKTLTKLIVASSDKAYGEHTVLPYTEELSLEALHPYDASKACADILARTYFTTYGLPVTVSRMTNIYGGGDLNYSRIVPCTIRSVLFNENPIIRSDGTPVRDYIYVKDVVNAYVTLAEHMDKKNVIGQAFNFGTEKPISVLDLVVKILEVSGKPALKPVILGKGKARGEIHKQYSSIKKAQAMLEWSPLYNLEEGLKETIEWYKLHFEKM